MKLQLVLKFIPELNGFLRCGRAGALLYFLLWTSATPSIRFTLTFSLNWKLAHGVLYTAQRLASFRLPVPLPCFCGAPVESLDHFFFYCPLAYSVLSWLQSLMFSFSFMCPALLLHHVRFGSVLMSCAQPPVSSSIFLTYVNSSSGNSGTTFVSVMSRLALWTLSPR